MGGSSPHRYRAPQPQSLRSSGSCHFAAAGGSRAIASSLFRLGVARLLRSQNIGPVHELDWGESLPSAGTTIHSVPALHFSARGLFDRNRTLWCGYVIEAADRMVYFAGDTGFRRSFRSRSASDLERRAWRCCRSEPTSRAGSCRRSIWVPEEAVRAHEILGAKTSIAIHHGTFQLADEGIDTPQKRLCACAPDDSFLVLNNGQSVTLA